jgi:hypothetical protein
MAGTLRVPRSRGGFSGLLLIVLGLWGGLVPFAGPAFHYGYGPAPTWTMTTGRLYLEVLPAIGAVLGGLIVLGSRIRPMATAGACLAAASGAWFAVGRSVIAVWAPNLVPNPGVPLGGSAARAVEQVGMFTGLGVAIAFLAALALGRLTVIAAGDAAIAGRHSAPAVTATTATSPAVSPADSAAGATAPAAAAEVPAGRPAVPAVPATAPAAAEVPAGRPAVPATAPAAAEVPAGRSAVPEPAATRPAMPATPAERPAPAEPVPAPAMAGQDAVAVDTGPANAGGVSPAAEDPALHRTPSGAAAP